VPVNPGPDSHYVSRPRVRERTREAALAALRRVDPALREAVRSAAMHDDPRIERDYPGEEAQIVPTNLDLVTIYISSTSIPSKHGIGFFSIDLGTGLG